MNIARTVRSARRHSPGPPPSARAARAARTRLELGSVFRRVGPPRSSSTRAPRRGARPSKPPPRCRPLGRRSAVPCAPPRSSPVPCLLKFPLARRAPPPGTRARRECGWRGDPPPPSTAARFRRHRPSCCARHVLGAAFAHRSGRSEGERRAATGMRVRPAAPLLLRCGTQHRRGARAAGTNLRDPARAHYSFALALSAAAAASASFSACVSRRPLSSRSLRSL